MGDKATTAVITVKVSDDGSEFTWGAVFTDLECDEFVSPYTEVNYFVGYPISGGKLRADVGAERPGGFGWTLTGEFTSPTTVAGSLELAFRMEDGSSSSCGTSDWSASQE